jgi:ABC-2 type transport system ATP-binding protein
MSLIDIKDITHYYGKKCVLDKININIEKNKIYGLLGKNGAGKTTLLNLLNNRVFPTAGLITVDGENVIENDNVLGKIFYMSETDMYPESMKIKNTFKWTKEFYSKFDINYAYDLSKKFELDINKKNKELSTGYRTISKIIAALAANTNIIVFDEPVLGLDANYREMFYKELLQNYINKPKTIILSTHIIDEVADIIERVIILNNKNIVIDEDLDNLLASAYCVSGPVEKVDEYIAYKNCINTEKISSFKSAVIYEKISDKDKLNAKGRGLDVHKVDLQKLFVYLTNQGGLI